MEALSKQEKERLVKEFEAKQERQVKTGKIIVYFIAIANIIGPIADAFTKFNFFRLVVQVVLSIALICGVVWVRYLFAVSTAIGAILMVYTLTTYGFSDAPAYLMIIAVVYMVYTLIASIVLFKSKSVSEFLYRQKNG